jgi:disulfide bond formation protein DsbB
MRYSCLMTMSTCFANFLFASPARALGLLGAGSAGVLATAFFFQHVLGYQPCILCIYQRWPYAAVIVFALAALSLRRSWAEGGDDALLVACGLALSACSAIAFYHVGVEQHWWIGTAACGGAGGGADSLDALRAQIMAAPVVRCDEPAWTLFGVSMAGYNILLAGGMAAYAFIAARVAYLRRRL